MKKNSLIIFGSFTIRTKKINMAEQKLKEFLFTNIVAANDWINDVMNKTGFEAELENDTSYGSLCYEDGPCDIRFVINRSKREIVVWPHMLEPNREILNHANDERLTSNMTTDEFVEFCFRIKQTFKKQIINKKLKEMKKDFK